MEHVMDVAFESFLWLAWGRSGDERREDVTLTPRSVKSQKL